MTGRHRDDAPPTETEILTELHRTLTETTGGFTEKIETLLAVGQSYLSMDAGLVAAVDEERYKIEIIHSDHDSLGEVPDGTVMPLSETVCERTLARGETFVVDDIPTEQSDLIERAAVSEYDGRRYIGTPISVADRTYGTLCFYGTETHDSELSARDEQIVEFIGQLVTYELEHHLQQTELETVNKELETVFERVDDAVFAVDTDWTVTYLNDRAEDALGIEQAALVGRNLFEQFPEAKGSVFDHQYSKALETQSTVTFEAPYEPLDAHFEVTAYPTESGLSVYFKDITERKQRRTELERYEQVLDTVPDGVYALDETEQFTYVNDGLADITGFDREELVGAHISTFKSQSTVDAARTAVNDEIRRLNRGEGTGEIEIDLTVERADGTQVPAEDHIALLPFDDRFRGSVGTVRDISEQVERERRLNGLLESARALMVAETTETVARNVVNTVEYVLDIDRAAVRLYDDDAERLQPIAVSAQLASESTLGSLSVDDGPVGSAFATGESTQCDAEDEVVADSGTADTLTVVPIGNHGTLSLGIENPTQCTNATHQLVELLAANAEAALDRTARQQELRRYETMVETVEEMLCVVDGEGRFQLLTEPLAELVGSSREALVGSSALELLSDETSPAVVEALESLFADDSQSTLSVDATVSTPDGELPVRIEAFQRGESNDDLTLVIHDRSEVLSAKREAAAERERFSYLFENLTDPINEIQHVDGEAQINSYNRAFERLFGEPATDDEKTPPLAVTADRIVDSESTDQRPEGDRELTLQTTEGLRYFLYRQLPYELRETQRSFEIFTDVTALKQREIQLQVLHRLLRHNLRNDLNVVAGFAELLAEEVDSPTHAEYAERIVSNVRDLIELSENAKHIEAVAGQQSLERSAVAVDEMVQTVVDQYQRLYPEAEIDVDIPAGITVSAGKHLQTALGELVENGLEHTQQPPAVRVSAEHGEGVVELTVWDNGSGIPDDEWAVITGDAEISQLKHGSGLGLWLVRWVAEAYGGQLTRWVDDEGSAVSIRLAAV